MGIRAMKRKTATLWLLLALVACTAMAAQAGNRSAVRKTVESSMLVTGMIDIEPDGTVSGHRLDKPEKLTPVLREYIGKTTAAMRFEAPILVDGKLVRVRTKMSLWLIANKQDNGDYQLRLGGASFGDPSTLPKEETTSVRGKLLPPRYPRVAHMSNITGIVYLVLKIGKQGTVEDVMVEQTNLTVLGTSKQMEAGRKMLEKASIAAAKQWMFTVPVRGEAAKNPYWVVRAPVEFLIGYPGKKTSDQSDWRAYVPGPRQRIPWISEEENRHSLEALTAGVVHPIGYGPKLVSSLDAGS